MQQAHASSFSSVRVFFYSVPRSFIGVALLLKGLEVLGIACGASGCTLGTVGRALLRRLVALGYEEAEDSFLRRLSRTCWQEHDEVVGARVGEHPDVISRGGGGRGVKIISYEPEFLKLLQKNRVFD